MQRTVTTRHAARRRRHAALVLALALLALPQAAAAAQPLTGSQITSPADPRYATYDAAAGPAAASNTLAVSGQVTGGSGPVDLVCTASALDGDGAFGSRLARANVPVGLDGSFTTTISLADVTGTCVLRAVPAGTLGGPAESAAALAPFAGPRLATGTLTAVTAAGAPVGVALAAAGVRASGLAGPPGAGVRGPVLLSAGLWPAPNAVFDPGARLARRSATIAGLPSTRSAIVVDGHNALTLDGVADVDPGAVTWAGAPASRVLASSVDAVSGEATLTTEHQLVRCSAYVPAGSEDATTCPAFVPAGVTLVRSVSWTQDMQLQTVADRWRSSDGGEHALDLLSGEQTDPAATTGGLRFGWMDAGYRAYGDGDVVSPPAGRVSTIYVSSDLAALDGDIGHPRGALTLSTPPDAITFGAGRGFELRYRRTVPATGALPITQTYASAPTQAALQSLASLAEQRAGAGLAVAITSATQVSGYDPSYVVSGRATAAGGVRTLELNGRAIPVAADGSWSTRMSLSPGANPLAATVTDNAGDRAATAGTVTFTPGPSQSSVLDGAVRRGVLAVRVRCQAVPGSSCSGRLRLSARVTRVKRTRRGRRRSTKTVTLALRSYSLPAGDGQVPAVRLGPSARKLVRKYRIRRATLTLSQTVGGVFKATKASVTVRL